jgi:DNA phosphorothioation-associated DGQHR protein 1
MIGTPSISLERSAIRVDQPLGTFFAFSLPADLLNSIAYSYPALAVERMESEWNDDKGYSILGSQRAEKKKRLDEIASFIQTTDATFPNAIILGVNYRDGQYIENQAERWTATERTEGCWTLRIPSTTQQSASIIDGQHRLHAFDRLPPNAPERKMELLCVAFLELPTPYHAYVFATINFNQKKVSKSDAYDMFGFDVDERAPKFWSPETLAVYLTRLLNTEKSSPLFKCILPSADSKLLFREGDESKADIRVSLATVVDGILRLISRNPMEDRNTIRRPQNNDRGRECLTSNGPPLRQFYIKGNDKAIFDLLCNYFAAVQEQVWAPSGQNSYLRKTVGVQALFDVLRELLVKVPIRGDEFSVPALTRRLEPCAKIDPDGTKYQASGIGRSEIRNEILAALVIA